MRKEFRSDTPELILIVNDKKGDSPLEKVLQKGLDRMGGCCCVLSLYVAKKGLKNLLKAIKLLHIKGAYIAGRRMVIGLKNKRYYECGIFLPTKKAISVSQKEVDKMAVDMAKTLKLWTNRTIDGKILRPLIRRHYLNR